MVKVISDTNLKNGYAIELIGVTRTFTMGESIIRALDDISLKINPGEFITVMGPSGSGKTTLVNVMAGLERLTNGKVKIYGQDLTKLKDDEKCKIRRHQIGIIFQFFYLHPTLSAVENVELPQLIAGVGFTERRKKAEELLEVVGLEKRSNHLPHELSGGEKQRVGIARAMANNPPIILADEPTGDMDHVAGAEILKLLQQLNEIYDKTVVMVTHDENMVKKGMRLLQMLDGKIFDDKTVEQDMESSKYWEYLPKEKEKAK